MQGVCTPAAARCVSKSVLITLAQNGETACFVVRGGWVPALLSWPTVTTLWIAWLIYWAISARNVARSQVREPFLWRAITLVVLGVAATLIFSPYFKYGFLGRHFVPDSQWSKGLGLTLILLGFAVSIWARRHLGRFWSARVTLKVDHQLIQSGPYASVRHPIYSGLLLAMLGTTLFVGAWHALLGVGLFFLAHWQKARREEALLAREFGVSYQQYRNQTGALIPRFF
jgi:protein-S-isoprenylcysteine O-methyltransferase Ste14